MASSCKTFLGGPESDTLVHYANTLCIIEISNQINISGVCHK